MSVFFFFIKLILQHNNNNNKNLLEQTYTYRLVKKKKKKHDIHNPQDTLTQVQTSQTFKCMYTEQILVIHCSGYFYSAKSISKYFHKEHEQERKYITKSL